MCVSRDATVLFSIQDVGAHMINHDYEQVLGGALASIDDMPATDCIWKNIECMSYGFIHIDTLSWRVWRDTFSSDRMMWIIQDWESNIVHQKNLMHALQLTRFPALWVIVMNDSIMWDGCSWHRHVCTPLSNHCLTILDLCPIIVWFSFDEFIITHTWWFRTNTS